MQKTWNDVRAEAVEAYGDTLQEITFEKFYISWLETNCLPPELNEPEELKGFAVYTAGELDRSVTINFPCYFHLSGTNGIDMYKFKPVTGTKRRQLLHIIPQKSIKYIQIEGEEMTNKVH